MNKPKSTLGLDTIFSLIKDDKCLFVCNHSGGKDSQIMYLRLREIIPSKRLVVIHAHLPEVEWDGTREFIESTTSHEFHVVQAGKTFFEMVEHRGMFPSPSNRQCTSDLKRGPIAKKIRHLCNQHGYDKVVNCMGLRAEESTARSKKEKFKINSSQTNSKRTWYEWLPIHQMTTSQVFGGIKNYRQNTFWIYNKGMTRKSCCFCIMASDNDLCLASKLRPELAQRYIETEERLDFTLIMPSKSKGKRFLRDIINEKKEVASTS